MRLAVASSVLLGIGATLLLAELRWFARPSLEDRLRPYVPGASGARRRSGPLSVASFRDVIGPLSHSITEPLARLFGMREELALRLERVHSPLTPTAFRVRQVGWMSAALVASAAVAAVTGLPAAVDLAMIAFAPMLAFLVVEQQLATASTSRQQRLVVELPVVAEQLAMLMGAGYSLGSALNRLAARGTGATAEDLAVVMRRVRQGMSEVDALREWAALADVKAVHRLVAVLALNREASDLGRLLGEEARSIRRDVHRGFVEAMDRRAQAVWIPVTVATLVPGAVFLAIPFIEALQLFSS